MEHLGSKLIQTEFYGQGYNVIWEKKKSLPFFNLMTMTSSIFCHLVKTVNRHFLKPGVVLFPYCIPDTCFWVLPLYYALQGLSLRIFSLFMQWKWNMECFSSHHFCLQLPECFVLWTSHSDCCGCYIWLLLYMQKLCPWIYSFHNNSYCVCLNYSDCIHCSQKT